MVIGSCLPLPDQLMIIIISSMLLIIMISSTPSIIMISSTHYRDQFYALHYLIGTGLFRVMISSMLSEETLSSFRETRF